MDTFIDRMKIEHADLVEKISKADAYLAEHDNELLTAQVHAMMTYASILECRLGSVAT